MCTFRKYETIETLVRHRNCKWNIGRRQSDEGVDVILFPNYCCVWCGVGPINNNICIRSSNRKEMGTPFRGPLLCHSADPINIHGNEKIRCKEIHIRTSHSILLYRGDSYKRNSYGKYYWVIVVTPKVDNCDNGGNDDTSVITLIDSSS